MYLFLRKPFIRPVPSPHVQAELLQRMMEGLVWEPILMYTSAETLDRKPPIQAIHPLVFLLPSREVGVEIRANNKGKMRFL